MVAQRCWNMLIERKRSEGWPKIVTIFNILNAKWKFPNNVHEKLNRMWESEREGGNSGCRTLLVLENCVHNCNHYGALWTLRGVRVGGSGRGRGRGRGGWSWVRLCFAVTERAWHMKIMFMLRLVYSTSCPAFPTLSLPFSVTYSLLDYLLPLRLSLMSSCRRRRHCFCCCCWNRNGVC